MLKAVIFDIDGTLIDSVDFHAQSWVQAFERFGHKTSFGDVRAQIGKGGDKLLPHFLKPAEVKAAGKAIEQFRGDLFKHEYMDQLRPFSGVRALFQKLIAENVQVALASSATEEELQVYKVIAEIDDLIDAETSSDDAEESKPEPDIFEAAQRRLTKVSAENILVIGDSPYDAIAARKAGMRPIGVLCGGFPERVLKKAGCVGIFQSPSNLLIDFAAWQNLTADH